MSIDDAHRQWRFILSLEDDLIQLSRFIEPVSRNFGATSIEISKLHNTACAGIEELAKELCVKINPNLKSSSIKSINNWAQHILQDANYKNIKSATVVISSFSLVRDPWSCWTVQTPPSWWTFHNKNKHVSFGQSTYEHCIDSICALFLLFKTYHQDTGVIDEIFNPRTKVIGTDFWPKSVSEEDVIAATINLG